MKNFFHSAVVAVTLFSFLLFSCQKEVNTTAESEIAGKVKPGDKEYNKCEIESITVLDPIFSWRSAAFEYNQHGDPTHITPDFVGTGNPKQEFRYDKKQRLTDYIGRYDGQGFEFWHKYGYDEKDRIIRDTQYVFGFYGAEPSGAILTYYIDYTYDNKNRISQLSLFDVRAPGPPFVQTYTYDVNGNLAGETYDDKVNIRRTNKIWMFIDRDYSVNNPINADVYNFFDLPTAFNSLNPGTNSFLHIIPLNYSTIKYFCKGKHEN
jgi:hypothetical protein